MTDTITQPKRTKTDELKAALKWKSGRSISDLSERIGWQSHTTRAALTRLWQAGLTLEKLPPGNGERCVRYRLVSSEAEAS